MNTMQEEWDVFKEMVIHKEANQVQIKEVQKVFYAGAAAFLGVMLRTSDLGDDAAEAILEGMHKELESFFENLQRQQ